MTQTYPNTPYAGQYQESREEFQVMGEQLVATVEKLVHEGNVRRIIIKQEGRIILEIPLTIGVVGAAKAISRPHDRCPGRSPAYPGLPSPKRPSATSTRAEPSAVR